MSKHRKTLRLTYTEASNVGGTLGREIIRMKSLVEQYGDVNTAWHATLDSAAKVEPVFSGLAAGTIKRVVIEIRLENA